MRYEYDAEMEPAFRQSLYKKFVKTIEKPNVHPLLVVDAINAKREHFEPFYQAALAKGYATFVASLDADIACLPTCVKDGEQPHFESSTCEDILMRRYAQTFSHISEGKT